VQMRAGVGPLGHQVPAQIAAAPSCAALGAQITQLRRPDRTVRGVSPVLLQMWIGPVPGSEMQAALSPVVATMRVWASPALLLRRWPGGVKSRAQMCDVVI
jgi:hypothetical protein